MKNNTILLGEVVLIFIVSFSVYISNGATLSSGDTVPNTLLAFNWLENHTLNFDNFKGTYSYPAGIIQWFQEGNYGHISSGYPIGSAIVTFPFYIVFYTYLKFIYSYASIPLDITAEDFETYRLLFEKLAATLTTSITVVIFYLSSRLKFSRGVSLLSTFIFAFTTSTWVTSSQGLWQHGPSNLAVVSTIFFLLKANRTSSSSQKLWLVLAGVACGLLPGIRPTSIFFPIAAIIYSVFSYRFQSILFCIGLVSALPSIAWNLYYFGNFGGAYSAYWGLSLYEFTIQNFFEVILGNLISPSHGLFVFSPIVFYSLPGAYQVFKLKAGKDEKLIGCMTIASIILLISYCFFTVWTAGGSYGSRFMTDLMPVACYLINYSPVNQILNCLKQCRITISFMLFSSLLIFSIFTQVVGAFGQAEIIGWHVMPIPTNESVNQYRLWQIRDSPIERYAHVVFHRIIKPPIDNSRYLQGLGGIVKQVTDKKHQSLGALLSVKPEAEMILKATLENTGISKWFGYESGLEKGEIRLLGRFYNTKNQIVNEIRLYVSGTPKQHELANALGSITFPKEPGRYKLIFSLISQGVGEFPKIGDKQPYTLDVQVEN